MNAEEFTTLAKMAVTAILVSLVLGAIFALWYKLSDPMIKYEKKTEKTMQSANMERLYELQDASYKSIAPGSESPPPLVSNVVSVLTEFKDDDLLYIYVAVKGQDSSRVYTYNNVSISDLVVYDTEGNVVTNNIIHETSSVPINLSCKYLLENSKYRCFVEIKPDVKYQNTSFIGLNILILPDEEVY